jgi:hypothetical protein
MCRQTTCHLCEISKHRHERVAGLRRGNVALQLSSNERLAAIEASLKPLCRLWRWVDVKNFANDALMKSIGNFDDG